MALTFAKLLVGLALGLVFALTGREVTNYGDLSFLLVTVITIATFFRVTRPWRWSALAVFALICVLLGLLLKMYIMVAPGA